MKTRIAGIDFGDVRIGIAVSDESRYLATPFTVVKAASTLKETASLILEALKEKEPIGILVLGLPLMMNGKDSPGSLKVRELATFLEELSDKTLVLWDERLTTAQVERTLKEAEMRRKKRAQYVDAMAASVILQSYLDSCAHK